MEKISQKLQRQLKMFLARTTPSCKAMTPLFSESLECPLTLREKISMKLHLFACVYCRRYVAQIELISRLLKLKPAQEIVVAPDEKLSEDARRRIKTALEIAAHKKN